MVETPLRAWFGIVEVKDPDPAPAAFLEELVRMLEMYRPALVDRARSSVTGEGARVEIELLHASEPEATVRVAFERGQAIVMWSTWHDHVFEREHRGAERPWTTYAVDAVAGILGGDYEIEDTYRGSKLVKTRVIDASAPGGPRSVGETGSLFGWIPGRAPRHVERRRFDFGVERP